MSTQTKFKIGDEVRVIKCGPDGKNDFSGDPVGMIGKVVRFSGSDWPYRLELKGKNPELYYPNLFAEDELELVTTPPAMPGIVATEWGVRSPWGDGASTDCEAARVTVKNMREAGHEASVIWRGVTEWQVKE